VGGPDRGAVQSRAQTASPPNGALIRTKCLIPQVRQHVVHRARLFARLESGMSCGLTLLCSPPGWGKTTLFVDWLRTASMEAPGAPVTAWLSLDERDNDTSVFRDDLVAALASAKTRFGRAVSPMPPPAAGSLRDVITRLVNELSTCPRDVILTLDDYHEIREPSVHEDIAFLLKHRPARLHVVIITREDPPIFLPRLRASGALCEIRAADLRFTLDEAATFLRDIMGLSLSDAEVARLTQRTEGWITGLQLSALSMPADSGSAGLGSHRPILDYLGQEVLARQPAGVRTFLLRTSVLNRLNSSLCNAVVGNEGPDEAAQLMLEQIERANLFLTALDGERRWYRYHHFFAEFLRVHLDRTEPDLVPRLHHRASEWYACRGDVRAAIHHALAASKQDRAVRLIEQHGTAIFDGVQLRTLLAWFKRLPHDAEHSRPLFGTLRAFVLFGSNRLHEAEGLLQSIDQHFPTGFPADEARVARGRMVLLRALIASVGPDRTGSAAATGQRLNLVPSPDEATEVLAGLLAVQALGATGDVTAAREQAAARAVERAKAAGHPVALRVGLVMLARVHALQGGVRRARVELGEVGRDCDSAPLVDLARAFTWGELRREWNELEDAEKAIAAGIQLITPARVVDAALAAEGYATLARIRQARGDAQGAMGALDDFVALALQRGFRAPTFARMSAVRAHLWLMQGNLTAAKRWADTAGPDPDDPVCYRRELEFLVLARVMTARKDRRVLGMLDRLLADAEIHGRTRSATEVLVLQSLAHKTFGRTPRWQAALERALALAEPEGCVGVFADEGAAMATLLRHAHAQGIAPEFVTQLLKSFGHRTVDRTLAGVPSYRPYGSHPERRPVLDALVDPLTPRESEILGLLASGASNQELAQRLFVTTNTIKAHVHHIFGKLGVKNRTQAIIRAQGIHVGSNGVSSTSLPAV
jgi:LuxR family transcriptional regulator, maltose regulon positive regulatory protein